MHIPSTKMAFAAAVLGGSLALGGCATRGYVDEQIATVNQRIDQLTGRVDGLDQRLSQQRAPRN